MPTVNPDAGLEVALEQRRHKLDTERQELAQRELVVQHEAALFGAAESRVQMVLAQIETAQNPTPGVPLPVEILGDLERLLQWCESQVVMRREVLQTARNAADEARGMVATAHQGVRALELVLEARAAERAEKQRRLELREADETAARVHQQKQVSR